MWRWIWTGVGNVKSSLPWQQKNDPSSILEWRGKWFGRGGSQGVKESVWMLIPWQLHPRECDAKGLK